MTQPQMPSVFRAAARTQHRTVTIPSFSADLRLDGALLDPLPLDRALVTLEVVFGSGRPVPVVKHVKPSKDDPDTPERVFVDDWAINYDCRIAPGSATIVGYERGPEQLALTLVEEASG